MDDVECLLARDPVVWWQWERIETTVAAMEESDA